ncbi:MAG: ParB/RepB/Spo0J family partition protein [Syntrophales bacterium]|jgi:ParB family chromosome partitioning protein|nr:ParB/RepB/Spo0J family partition protein [Syntrophales bacterium]
MATAETYTPSQLYSVPLAELQSDPNQPRKYLDSQALEELTASVVQHGVLEPILFRQDKQTGFLYVIAGERRCAAARKAGLSTVPAVFIDSDNYAEIALVENILRQDLTPVEEAEALKRLQDEHAYKQEDLARILGKAPATISETLSLTKLPQQVRDECRQDPSVPKKVLIGLAKNKQQRSMITQYQKYRKAQAKAAAPTTRTTAKTSPAQTLAGALETVEKKISALDFGTFSGEDVQLMFDAMKGLQITLKETIARIPQ